MLFKTLARYVTAYQIQNTSYWHRIDWHWSW